MYSGQGSQYYQMGKMLFEQNNIFRKYLEEADRVSGLSTIKFLYNENNKKSQPFLDLSLSHPAIFIVEYALSQMLLDSNIKPDKVLGASVGEFAAAVQAGILKFDDALELVIHQAESIKNHIPEGGMIAILEDIELYENKNYLKENSELAGINFSKNFVVAAEKNNLKMIEENLRKDKLTFQVLPVNFPFHSSTPTWTAVIIHLLTQAGDQGYMQIAGTKNGVNSTHTLDLSNWRMDDLKPDPLKSLGIKPYEPEIPAIVGKIAANSPASQSELKIGDKILTMNGQPVKSWEEVMKIISDHPDTTLPVSITRNNVSKNISIPIGYKRNVWLKKTGYLGIGPQFEWPKNLLHKNKYSPMEALKYAWNDTNNFIKLNFIILGKMLTGKISIQSLGGPISIFEIAGESLNNGIIPYLVFLAFLSISIGVINILPIPGLDGGHILFQAIEVVSRRPASLRLQFLLYRLGFIFLLLLIIQTLFNDILRLKF
jgi:RIP metalloprotease RseP